MMIYKKYLKDITNLIPVFYDMCENSCICYTGQYEFYQNCPICNSTRFDTKGKAKKIMPYLSIKNRLQIQFNDEKDIAFTASCDGYQIFRQKTDDCWLFLMINNNLDPSLRVKKENLMIPFLIPGPNQPKDFNTFLQPFVNEMKELESKYIV